MSRSLQRIARIAMVLWALALGSDLVLALEPGRAMTQYQQDVWTEREGLPQGSVQAILQTSDGYLWIGTRDGLARFDGVRFSVFRAEATPGLNSSDIRALAEDRSGRLWIGTFNGGLSCYARGEFKAYTSQHGLPGRGASEIYEDRTGSIWVGASEGLARLNGSTWTTYGRQDGLRDSSGWSFFENAEGQLWVAAARGLYRFTGEHFELLTEPLDFGNEVIHAAFAGRRGDVWIAAGDSLWSIREGLFKRYTSADGLPQTEIRAITEDSDGNLWLGTWTGLCRFSGGSFATYSRRDGLPHDHVEAIFEDREGSLWIGTRGGGLARLRDGKLTNFTTKEGLAHDFAKCIFEDRHGAIWIGTHGGGLSRYYQGRFRSFGPEDGLRSQFIWSVTEDRDGNVWIGTGRPASLARFSHGRFTSWGPSEGLLIDGGIRVVYGDREGNLWIGGDGGGLARFQAETFTYFTTQDGLASNFIRAIAADSHGHLWIGTTEGLSRFRDGRFTTYSTDDGLAHNVVYAICEDSDGALWFGTQGGLTRYADGQFRSYTPRDGFVPGVVYQILEDGLHHLWMSSNRGIFSIDKRSLAEFDLGKARFVNGVTYGIADGMKASQCEGATQPAGWKTRDGKLWFPTASGVSVIDPKHIPFNSRPPPVLIEQVVVDNRALAMPLAATLSPNTREIRFHYTALSFLAPDKIRFRYRLEGLDSDWVDAETRRSVSYAELAPGKYRFQVSACNADGVWNESGATFAFALAPHFYQTGWFYALCVLVLALFALSFHRYRLRKAHDEFSLVLAERNRIARDLHDTLAQGFAGIAFQLEAVAAKLKDAPHQAQQHLDVALNMVRHSLAEARRSVMDLRSAALEKSDLPTALSETARQIVADKPVQIDLRTVGTPVSLAAKIEDNLLRVGQEAITNALKHSQATAIQICLTYTPRSVVLSVSDNGKGFNPQAQFNGNGARFGLRGMHERANQIGGALKVSSQAGRGTEIYFEVPIARRRRARS